MTLTIKEIRDSASSSVVAWKKLKTRNAVEIAFFAAKAKTAPPVSHRTRLNSWISLSGKGDAYSMAMARDHRKLEAFTLADQLAIDVYLETADFPASERFGLQSQLRRAAVSAATNIVEGCARESLGDYLRFLNIAFSSTREVIYLVSLAVRLSYLPESEANRVTKLADRAAGALLSLRRSLR